MSQAIGTVSGTVHYGDTRKAAGGIRVWLTREQQDTAIHPDPKTGEYIVRDADQPSSPQATQVGSEGHFMIAGVSEGTYLLHTYSPGYVSPDDTVYPTSNTTHVANGVMPGTHALRVTVSQAAPKAHIDVVLQLGGVIEGIVPETGSGQSGPNSSVAVKAERKQAPNSYARTGGAAHTDATGHYRLEGLAPGDYIVFRAGPSMTVHAADGSTLGGSGLPIYAPQTIRPSEATVVHVTGSETHRLDFAPPQRRALHSVHGTVSAKGNALPRLTLVRMYPSGEGGLTAAIPLDAANGFCFDDVPDGVYTVSVDFPPFREFVGADLNSGTIRMRMRPASYTSVSQEVHVAGSDVNEVALHPSPTSSASAP